MRKPWAAVAAAPDVLLPDSDDPEEDDDPVDELDPDPDEVPVADEPDSPDEPVPVAVAVEKPEEVVFDAPSCPPGAPPLPGSAVLVPSVVDTAWAVGALPDSLLLLLSPLPPPLPPFPLLPPLPPPLPPVPGVGEAEVGVAAAPPAAGAVVGGRTVVKLEVALTSTQSRS